MVRTFKYLFFLGIFIQIFFSSCREKDYESTIKKTFIKFWGTSNIDEAKDVFLSNDEDYIISGAIYNYNLEKDLDYGEDVFITKLSQSAVKKWTFTFSDTLDQIATAVTQTKFNQVFAAVTTNKIKKGLNYKQIEVIKIAEDGTLIDSLTYNFDFSLYPTDILYQSDSSIFILGYKSQNNSFDLIPPYDIFLYKINLNLDSIWFRTYGGSNNDIANKMINGPNHNIRIVGSTSSFSSFEQAQSNILVIETDSNGLLVDKITLGNLQNNYGYAICNSETNRVVVAGAMDLNNSKVLMAYKVELYSHKLIWGINFGQKNDYIANTIVNDNENFFIAGSIYFVDNSNSDFMFLKLNQDGDTLWTKTYGAEGNEQALSAILSPLGGYLVVGNSEFKTNQMITTIKLSPDGKLEKY